MLFFLYKMIYFYLFYLYIFLIIFKANHNESKKELKKIMSNVLLILLSKGWNKNKICNKFNNIYKKLTSLALKLSFSCLY